MKIFLFYILIILNLVFISATQLSISPPELFINGTIGKESCEEIEISSDYNGNIIGESKWSLSASKELNDYTLNPEYFRLVENYPKKIYFEGKDKKQVNICFKGEKQGSYNGILIYKTERGYAGIGIWIHLILENKKDIGRNLILYSSPTPLLIILLFLLIIKKNGWKSSK